MCPGGQRIENPKCINCGEKHPANYRGCEVANKLQKMRNNSLKNKKQKGTTKNSPNVNSRVEEGRSYSQAAGARAAPSQPKEETSPTINDLLAQLIVRLDQQEQLLINQENATKLLADRIKNIESGKRKALNKTK